MKNAQIYLATQFDSFYLSVLKDKTVELSSQINLQGEYYDKDTHDSEKN